jgi:hypothetical protein
MSIFILIFIFNHSYISACHPSPTLANVPFAIPALCPKQPSTTGQNRLSALAEAPD